MPRFKEKLSVFHIYRYHISTISKSVQTSFHPYKIDSLDKLIEMKNDILEDVLLDKNFISSAKEDVRCKLESHKNEVIMIRLGKNRGAELIDENFKKTRVPNWPNSIVLFNNNPQIQKIAIQHNPKLFGHSETLMRLITHHINKRLREFNLDFIPSPMFDKKVFWDIIKLNRNKILKIDFELIRPNLSSISKSISEQFKDMQKITNAKKANVKIQSDKDSALDISKDNKYIAGFVDYASEGGGDIKVRVRGETTDIHTTKNIKKQTISEIEFENLTIENVKELLPELFKIIDKK